MHIKDIQEQFNRVISYSQGIENPNTDELFRDWAEAKRDFIEAMQGKLIWEWPEKVSFELEDNAKNLRIDDFIDMLDRKWALPYLADFIYIQKEGFFSNQVIKEYKYEDITIPKGMKLLKAFKYFIKDTKMLNDIQSAASMVIQENKIEGTLCFSVHPLDYLSSSENNHNWRSCHSLNGEYRSGNLSYMVDPHTVVCYLKSNKKEVLPNFPEDVLWNSKKWRVLLFFSNDWRMIFAGRQYPFSTDAGLNFVKERMLQAMGFGEYSSWLNKKIRRTDEKEVSNYFFSPYIPVYDKLIPMNELVQNEKYSLQFNDLISSSCYDPVYCFRMVDHAFGGKILDTPYLFSKKTPSFRIGGAVKCLRCGKEYIEISGTMMCNDCELEYGKCEDDTFATCPCCGNRFFFDDGYWVDQTGETICPDCGDNYTDYCDNCGERYYKEDMIYSEKLDDCFCKWCYEDIAIEEGI